MCALQVHDGEGNGLQPDLPDVEGRLRNQRCGAALLLARRCQHYRAAWCPAGGRSTPSSQACLLCLLPQPACCACCAPCADHTVTHPPVRGVRWLALHPAGCPGPAAAAEAQRQRPGDGSCCPPLLAAPPSRRLSVLLTGTCAAHTAWRACRRWTRAWTRKRFTTRSRRCGSGSRRPAASPPARSRASGTREEGGRLPALQCCNGPAAAQPLAPPPLPLLRHSVSVQKLLFAACRYLTTTPATRQVGRRGGVFGMPVALHAAGGQRALPAPPCPAPCGCKPGLRRRRACLLQVLHEEGFLYDSTLMESLSYSLSHGAGQRVWPCERRGGLQAARGPACMRWRVPFHRKSLPGQAVLRCELRLCFPCCADTMDFGVPQNCGFYAPAQKCDPENEKLAGLWQVRRAPAAHPG